jgi:nucleoside-diphosphate-sugar epimerase
VRILVTGAGGFLGSRVVSRLAEGGHDVVAADNGFRGTAPAPAGVEALELDVRDAEAVRRACSGSEVVLHLAAIQGTGNFYAMPDVVLDVNLRGMLNVAEACASEGVRRLFFSSSSECYAEPRVFPTPETEPLVVPDPLNPRWSYGGSKIAGELVTVNYARQRGFEFTVVRYHNVYGPAMGWDHVLPQFIRRLELGEEFTIQGDGEQRRSFCFVDDAVDCTLAAALLPEGADEIFNIGNPDEEYTINEVAALLARVSGKPIEPRHVAGAEGGTPRRVPDVSRARERLSFVPNVSFEAGLRRTYEWYAAALREERQP